MCVCVCVCVCVYTLPWRVLSSQTGKANETVSTIYPWAKNWLDRYFSMYLLFQYSVYTTTKHACVYSIYGVIKSNSILVCSILNSSLQNGPHYTGSGEMKCETGINKITASANLRARLWQIFQRFQYKIIRIFKNMITNWTSPTNSREIKYEIRVYKIKTSSRI